MDTLKYKIVVSAHCENYNGKFDVSDEPDCEFTVFVNSLENKPTLKDVLKAATMHKCADVLFVQMDIEDAYGNYVDHDEVFVKLDYEKQVIEVIND